MSGFHGAVGAALIFGGTVQGATIIGGTISGSDITTTPSGGDTTYIEIGSVGGAGSILFSPTNGDARGAINSKTVGAGVSRYGEIDIAPPFPSGVQVPQIILRSGSPDGSTGAELFLPEIVTINGGPHGATGNGSAPGLAYANLSTRCFVTVPAGRWMFAAKGWLNNASANPQLYGMRLWDGTTQLDQTVAQIGGFTHPGAVGTVFPFALLAGPIVYAASTTVEMQWYTGAIDGTQLLQDAKLFALPC